MIYSLVFPGELPTLALFGELALAGLVVILAGWHFVKIADSVATRLNLSAGWVGLILVAGVTSLPELVTAGTATALGNVDLAMGGILGSCSFNITIIFLLNAIWGGGSLLKKAGKMHALSSSFGLMLIGLALIGLVVIEKFSATPAFANVLEWGWVATIALAYLFCMKLIYRYERSKKDNRPGQATQRQPLGARLTLQVLMMAGILAVASWWLAKLGDVLSEHKIEWLGRPLGATFVGAGFLALATSLPEIATSIAAVKLGKLDLALANIFGSNMFNIAVIPILKVVSVGTGSQLLLSSGASSTTQNLIAGLLAMLLTTVAIGGIAYQSQRKVLRRFGFDSILIMVGYVVGMIFLVMD